MVQGLESLKTPKWGSPVGSPLSPFFTPGANQSRLHRFVVDDLDMRLRTRVRSRHVISGFGFIVLASDGRPSISGLGVSELASMDDRKQRTTRTGANKGQRERPCRGSGLTSGIRALAADNDIAPAAGDGTPMSGIGDCALASGDIAH